ncbi:CGNR zinc finger domain-containing protein [Mucilaginibacter corticis]|uniref:CGNR zinc finger domain-containing protein n=1 Tax=Mucilaginibacter corticis TaxID=2597670 RepID=A0A556MVG7_9SPHI|nr:CGNR zinc finger domain-containing protein [Mucilaginibacter corticis]TSJ43931.1 CGNR zinc finger domain-containing protein [Mucilaginibacter corticis]
MKQSVSATRRKPAEHLTDGGNHALNFINTLRHHRTGGRYDLLTDYHSFIHWAQQTNLINWDRYMELDLEGRCYEEESRKAYGTLMTARTTLGEIFISLMKREEIHPLWLERFNDYVERIRPHLRYDNGINGLQQYWHDIDEQIHLPFWLIIREACNLINSGQWRDIKQCPACKQLFLDTSRAGNRTWCSPQTCGSIKKSQRYYRLKVA